MKITGTKKLWIILFALTCVITLGLGAFFGGWFFKPAVSASAETEEKVTLPDNTQSRLYEISAKTGLGVEALTFYVKSNGGTENELCEYYDIVGQDEFVNTVTKLLTEYASGELETANDITDEDWYISPDEASTYAYLAVGNADTFTAFYTSKNMVTNEAQYFRNVGFMMGPYAKVLGPSEGNVNDRNDFAWHEAMYYNFAWVEEGEEFYFGLYSTRGMYERVPGAITTEAWMNGPTQLTQSYSVWCTTAAAIAAGYSYGPPTPTYISGTWFNPTTGIASNDPDPTRNNKAQYLDEFGSTINPSTTYMSGLMQKNGNSRATSSASGWAGQLGIWLSADAPSGTYYFTLGCVENNWNNRFYNWNGGTSGGVSSWAPSNNFVDWTSGTENWRYRMGFAVSICRTGITTPRLKFNTGVDSQLKNKEVDYDGSYHELIIENDWGPGLITYNIQKWDDATNTWGTAYANNTDIAGVIECVSRSVAGTGVQGDTVFRAKDAGKYKITMTPYRNWETENDRDPIEFTFTINPKKLESPTIFGELASATSKTINATGRMLYITLYPVLDDWVDYTCPSITNSFGTFALSQEGWDDNGVLTLGGTGQGTYTITISIEDPLNVAWDTPVPPGDPPDTADKVFTFIIGPMKVAVPEIIQGGGGSVSQFKKEVIYNGAQQTLSFMPINPSQLIINAVNLDTNEEMTDISTDDQTLTVRAKDAGHYKVTVNLKPEYIFDGMSGSQSTVLDYELIIHEAEIDAPYLCAEDEAVAVDNVKTVTYGGEKIAGTSQDWVATLTFDNADQARIDWVSLGSNISQTGWSDSKLTLAAKPADTYIVTFKPKKNYKWKDGVVVPNYKLIIEKLKIAKPEIYVDNEVTPEGVHATYTDTSKSIGFDNAYHPIMVNFPTLPETIDIPYTKQSSVYTLHEGNFETSWNGDIMTKTGREAGTFKITITPTNNYCWSNGSSDPVIFTFTIVPINVDCLDMYTTNEFGDGMMEITDASYNVNLNYDGTAKTVRIGNPDAEFDRQRYLTTGDYAMEYHLLDKDGVWIDPAPDMTVSETGGFLTVTMVEAGVYRIGVALKNTNYWWTESNSSMMVYTLTINAEGVNAPKIDEGKSVGNNTENNFGADIMRGTFAEVSDEPNGHKFFMLVAAFDDTKYSQFVKITDKYGVVYDYATVAAMGDSAVAAERNDALAVEHGVYTLWLNKEIRLYAFDQGTYTWTLELTSDNYKWVGTESRTITLTIDVKRSPVSGVEMRYVGDEDEAAINTSEGFLVGDSNVKGDEYNSDKIVYSSAVFSEKWKAVRFVQTTVSDMYKAGFATQFEYEVYKTAANGNYTDEILEPVEAAFTFEELRLEFFDAGTYEIRIRPKDNYCWNNDTTSTSRSYVVFKLVIETLTIEKPVVKDPTGDGLREVLYNHEFQLFQLDLKKYPNGYKVRDDRGFEYINDDYADRVAAGDTPEVHIEGTSAADAAITLGVNADDALMNVEARSAGEYQLRIVVSNINNYKFSTGDSSTYYQYRFVIKKISVAIPDAYISEETLSSDSTSTEYVDAIKYTEAQVTANALLTTSTPINYSTQYQGRREYCGRYYAIYLYGTEVKLGSFEITAAPDDTINGDATHVLQPDQLTVPGDEDSKLGYYRLAVREVSTYTITLNFVTADYYWGSDFTSGSVPREYEFTLSKKLLDIPEIVGYQNTPLISDSLTVEKTYSGNQEAITIKDIPFGELISTSPDVYSFVNLVYNADVTIDTFTVGTDGKASVTMKTAGVAEVPVTYCLELKINSNNAAWNRGTTNGSKYYYIDVVKAKVQRPVLEGSDTGDTRTVTYNAFVWENALKIKNMDPNTDATTRKINYVLSSDAMAAVFDGTETDKLLVSTINNLPSGSNGADVGNYDVVVSLRDSDNYEWSTGDIADITFSFVIEPMPIARPYIYIGSSTEAAMGVVGLTRTVTYEWDSNLPTPAAKQYDLDIGNYWDNSADTSAAVTAPQYTKGGVSVTPTVMNYIVSAGTPDGGTLYYVAGQFTANGTAKYGDMLYNEYNNGILTLKATNAGTYTVTFSLTDNAIWANGSTDDIDVTLVIKKLAHEDPFIVAGATGATVDDRTATYTYELDTAGAAIERTMQIGNYNADTKNANGTVTYTYDYMSYDSSLTVEPASGYLTDGNSSGTVYTFKATNSGTYVVTFTIDDPANHCWKFADVAAVSFTIQINKLTIANPVIETDYLLVTEKVDGTELSVDFDKREHTILVKSLFENIYDSSPAYGVSNPSGLGSKYFKVENATDTVQGTGYTTTHANRTDFYDATTGLTVANLFDKITPLPTGYYSYNGDKKTNNVNLTNLFTLTAYTPGEYYLRFTLTDANMTWADVTSNFIDYKLVINKVEHDAPILAPGTSNTQEYDGGDVYFTLKNVYNGIKEEGSTTVVATVSEQFKIISYTGPDTTITTPTALNPASFVHSWYDGSLTLKLHSIGTYIVEVSITDPDYIKWNGTTITSKPFTLVVTERTLEAEVTLRSNDSETDAALKAGASNWSMSNKVFADVLISGIRYVPAPTSAIDDNVAFDVYYAKVSDPTTKIYPSNVATGWIPTPNNDGTYNLFFTYGGIQNGRGNIDKGNYILVIEQDTTVTNCNYILPTFTFAFTIDADPAPFKEEMLVWSYSSSDIPLVTTGVGPFGNDASNPLHLPYRLDPADGVTPVAYTFHLGVSAPCLAGHSTDPGPFTDVQRALQSWKVDWDGTYGDTRTSNSATVPGTVDKVSITLTAFNPAEWAFDTTTYELYYVIDQALYDISDLVWDYDATSPFEFDDTAKTVQVIPLSGTMPTDLTIDHYETTCTEFVSYVFGASPYVGSESMVSTNSRTYAGKYSTTVFFQVTTPSNYVLPEDPAINPDKTYTDVGGSFVWTITWEIKPRKIEVDWTQGGTSTSDGDTITRQPSTVAGTHASKFDYYKEKEVTPGTWAPVTSLDRVPGQTVTYRVEAYLKSNPSTPATDYARNYVAEFIGKDNPCLMEVGGDDTVIVNHITVNGDRKTNYEYTGDPVEVDVVIDFDTSNGAITESDITVLFVNLATPTVQSPTPPSDIGNYKVVLKLAFTALDETYALSEAEYPFNIVKAQFHPDDLEWHYTHTTADATIEAKYVPSMNKWVNVADNSQADIVYDGFAYDISLVSSNSNLTFTMSSASQIDANPLNDDETAIVLYVTTATAVFDGTHYEFHPTEFTGTVFEYDTTLLPTVAIEFEWEIEKAFLDLSKVNWDYSKPFEFTLVNGTPKAFKVELTNLPEYLKDKIDYTVERSGVLITDDVTNEGTYKTTAAIRTADISYNYVLGTWPAAVATYVDWIVNPKRLDIPQNDMSWAQFDGTQHNLLKPFGLDVDWEEYFGIAVTYEDFDGVSGPYDGTLVYGGKYYAYNAGIYTFTFTINKDYNVTVNSQKIYNIVWKVTGGSSYDTDNDQTVTMTVDKRTIKVTGWFEDYENSYVRTAGNLDVSRFVEYKFYMGSDNTGTEVSLDRVLESGGNETFSMAPVVRKAYQGNIILTFEPNTDYTTFTTEEISEEDAQRVNGKPFIYGYAVDGRFTQFTSSELAAGDVFVTYMGKNVTFRIYDWDYYKQYVEVWNGDDLTQIEAGKYSLTLVLRKDLDKPLYWGIKADGTLDRSSVTLTFEIRYNMLTIPVLPSEVTFAGSEINILSLAENETLAKLEAQYGDYVEIVGDKATDVGEQTLYLRIKEEYSLAVRWNDGTEQGKLGTLSFAWKILPVLIQKPEVDPDASITYDGEAHSVYELLKGYDKTNPSTAIATLMANVNEENARSVNAGGPFSAVLSLPSTNYAWCDASGKKLDDRTPWTHDWYISKKQIDFKDAYWGYMDGDTPTAYDPDKPFVYTLVNGAAKEFSVEILGLPEILKLYTTYTTNGNPGNSASAVNSGYTTRVEIDLDRIDTQNYTIVPGSYETINELVWSIVPREFDLPEYNDGWTEFDAKVHDLVALLGLGEDWAEYFDVKVEYKVNEGDVYAQYNGDNMLVVGYSLYKGFNYGYYRLTVTLKNNGSLMEPGVNLKWKDGASNPEAFEIIVDKYTVTIIGWNESDEYSEVYYKDYGTLPAEIADRLEYILYEDGNPDTLLDRSDVASSSGNVFFIDYRFKQGTDANGVAYSYGIDLVFETGVAHPYEFGTRSYGTQPIIWVPKPILEKAVLEYNGEAQTFVIKDFETLYRMSDAERISLNYNHNLSLDASNKSYVYLQVANSLTATAADEYSAVVRLLGPVRLSWYDPALYVASSDKRTLYESDGVTPVSDPTSLFNNKSIILNFKIKKKAVPMLTDEDLDILKGMVVTYDGTEKDVVVEKADVFKILEDKYGKIFAYAGTKGTAADDYTLEITLKDPDSCIWYEGEPEKVEVSAEGYELRYVKDGADWKIIYVKKNDSGPETDASGNYIEYNDGDYSLDVKYLPEFVIDLIKISDYVPTIIDTTTGQLNIEHRYLYDSLNNIVKDKNGNDITYQYVMDGTTIKRFNSDGTDNPTGDYVKRIKLSLTVGEGDPEYGYKVPVKEDVKAYIPLYANLVPDAYMDPIPATDEKGNVIALYLVNTGGNNYELREYQLDANGRFIPDGASDYLFTVKEALAEMVDVTKSYNLISGEYVEHPTNNGDFMQIYVRNSAGIRQKQVVYAKDENGNFVIDVEHTVITKNEYTVVNDKKFEVDWKIDSSILTMPVFDETLMQQYTGKTLYAKDVLKGFLPDLMTIVEGGEGVNAGEYTAKIVLTTDNSKWNPEDTTENYVLVTWRIDTAKVDLSEISWYYTDGTNTYTDSDSFVYTRKDGKPVVFWVGIANLPEVLKDRVVFNTNNKVGAYAGNSAGQYRTSVSFSTDDGNFDTVVIPSTFETSIVWNIKRRMLSVPDSNATQLVFDNEKHDLLKMLGVPSDWKEYYDIQVMYSDGGDYVPYAGYEGDPYVAYGFGSYKFTFAIKSGINTSVINPNVVWIKSSGETEVPIMLPPDEGDSLSAEVKEELPPVIKSVRKPVKAEVEEEITETVEKVVEEKTEIAETAPVENVTISATETAIREVCDRLKQLTYGAELNLQAFRKYSVRGTL